MPEEALTSFTICDVYRYFVGQAYHRPTGWSKNPGTQFYFRDNFGISAPILTILSLLQAEIYGA